MKNLDLPDGQQRNKEVVLEAVSDEFPPRKLEKWMCNSG